MRTVLAVAMLWLLPHQAAWAWGQEGHSIVAEIAQQRLTPAAAAAVKALLGGDVSLASIASWADDIRDERPDTYNWHFVDMPLDVARYDPALYCKPDPNKGDCVINAIARARATLGDRKAPKARRTEALMFLVHFVGDVHQPLHTVADNEGENTLHVSFFTDPTFKTREETNLHAVWDQGLIHTQFWDWGAYVRWLNTSWFPGKTIARLSAGTPVTWAEEAHKVAHDDACPGVTEGAALDQAYIARVRPLLDQQLALAGLRLARLLNETLR